MVLNKLGKQGDVIVSEQNLFRTYDIGLFYVNCLKTFSFDLLSNMHFNQFL